MEVFLIVGLMILLNVGSKNMDSIIKFKVDEEILTQAKEFEQEIKKKYEYGYNKESYRQGRCLLDSLVSEIAISKYFDFKWVRDFNYDFISPKNEATIDLKTKPRSDFEPKPNWYATVPAYQKENQDCEYYIFNRLNKAMDTIWALGFISKKDFIEKSRFVKKGEVDPDSSPRKVWVCPEDSYYLKISELKDRSYYGL